VLWEVLAGRPLFEAPNESAIIHRLLYDVVSPPSKYRQEVSAALDAIVLRGLAREADERFESAEALLAALEAELRAASQSEVSAWLHGLAGDQLKARAEFLKELQRAAESSPGLQAARSAADSQPLRPRASDGASPEREPWEQPDGTYTLVRSRKPGALLWGLAALSFALGVVWLWPSSAVPAARPSPPAKPVTRSVPVQLSPAHDIPFGAALPADAAADWANPQPAGPKPEIDARRSGSAPRAPTRPKSARDCREPYVIDALGVKRWKRECL
jgi:eukaryotic-like serine/threonine-protein kinase